MGEARLSQDDAQGPGAFIDHSTTFPGQSMSRTANASSMVPSLAACQLTIDFKILLLLLRSGDGLTPEYLSDRLLLFTPPDLSGPLTLAL